MRGKYMLYSWLFAIWLLIGSAPAAYAYTQVTPPSAWRTTPTLSKDMQPAYQFHSTSVYTPTVNVTVYTPVAVRLRADRTGCAEVSMMKKMIPLDRK